MTPKPKTALPCPFCGNATLTFNGEAGPRQTTWVECETCNAQGPEIPDSESEDNKANALDAWNVRPVIPPIPNNEVAGRFKVTDDKKGQLYYVQDTRIAHLESLAAEATPIAKGGG